MTNGPERVPLEPVDSQQAPKATFAIASYTFLRVLGLCLLATFVSKLGQMPALLGSHGITPLADLLTAQSSKHGDAAWWRAPSLFWLASSDGWLMTVTWFGLIASALLTLGVAPRLACTVCYVVYISFRTVDDVPLRWCNWPFDELLTEATFLAIWLAPRGLWSSLRRPANPPAWARWLLIWLLFRLMFGTGITKLMAGGTWLELDALHDFLLTQPQPTALAAWCSDLPAWLLRAGAAYTICFEVIAPWLLCWPGRVRRVAAMCGMPLMLGIYLCGNFRGLNLLSAALLLMAWDDQSLLRLLPSRWRSRWRSRFAIAQQAASATRDRGMLADRLRIA